MRTNRDMLSYLGIELLDENELAVLKILEAKNKIDESKLAEQMEVKVNAIRKVMYRLGEQSYATYDKKKSKDKKWWYVYYWTLNKSKIVEDYIKKKNDELAKLNGKLAIELEFALICDCGEKYRYEEALENDFMCAKCDASLEQIDSSKVVRLLRQDISTLQSELNELAIWLKKQTATKKKAKSPRKQSKASAKNITEE